MTQRIGIGMARSRSRYAVSITCLLLLCTSGIAAQTVGHAFEAEGNWRLQATSRPLQRGDAIRGQDVILAPADSSGGGTLTLWLPSGRLACTARTAVRCFAAKNQEVPCVTTSRNGARLIRVADCLRTTSQQEAGIFAAVYRWFQQDPRRFVPLISRSGIGGYAGDAVLLRNREGVDLAPIFAGLPRNEYQLCARLAVTANRAEPEHDCSRVELVRWRPGSTDIRAEPLHEGLYQVEVSSKAGRDNAWVLVLDSASFPSASQKFQRAVEATSRWSEPHDQSEVRAFLRAFLLSLSKTH